MQRFARSSPRVLPAVRSRYAVRLLVITPSISLESIALEQMHNLPGALRAMLRLLGGGRPNSAGLLSYLLFEPGFTSLLIELGRRDAMAKRAEIEALLAP